MLLRLRKPWRDGTTWLRFEPLAFIERLASLVPRPRVHSVTDHGALTATLETYLDSAGLGPDDIAAAGFDLSTACSSFINALMTAHGLLARQVSAATATRAPSALIATSQARLLEMDRVACASTGNTSASMAASPSGWCPGPSGRARSSPTSRAGSSWSAGSW